MSMLFGSGDGITGHSSPSRETERQAPGARGRTAAPATFQVVDINELLELDPELGRLVGDYAVRRTLYLGTLRSGASILVGVAHGDDRLEVYTRRRPPDERDDRGGAYACYDFSRSRNRFPILARPPAAEEIRALVQCFCAPADDRSRPRADR